MKRKQNSYPVRLEPELTDWLKTKAQQGDRSLNAQINRALRELKEHEESTNHQANEAH